MSSLMFPVRVDALHLPVAQNILGPDADFSLQPYPEAGTNKNPTTPNNSDFILRGAFGTPSLTLPAGIHLHWTLPDFLTKGQRAAGPGQPIQFPVVPNRWLVTRFDKRPGTAVQQASFLVESDFVHPRSAGDVATSPNIPAAPDANDARPFRYIGRTTPLDATTVLPTGSQFLGNLTATGYGIPTFASFYPNCRNVFGMHDAISVQPADLGLIEYTIMGSCTDAAQDFIGQQKQSSPPNEDDVQALKPGLGFRFVLFKSLVQGQVGARAGSVWQAMHDLGFLSGDPAGRMSEVLPEKAVPVPAVPPDATVLNDIRSLLAPFRTLPRHMECYAHIRLVPPAAALLQRNIDSITLGSTTPDALASHLALRVAAQNARLAEDEIDAVLLGEQLDFLHADVPQKLAQTKHRNGFRAVSGETLWVISRASSPTGQPDDGDVADLPAALVQLLHDLNGKQAAYDAAAFQIESARRQLFMDWCKYIRVKYLPDASIGVAPAIRAAMQSSSLPQLTAKQAATGQFNLDKPLDLVNSPQDTAARRVALSAKVVKDAVDAHNATLATTERPVVLHAVPGQRFWAPNDPAVVLTGTMVQPNDRHVPGILDATIADQFVGDVQVSQLSNFGTIRAARFGHWPIEDCGAPWNPLALDWRVQFTPRVVPDNGDFALVGSVTRQFQLDADAADLHPAGSPAANQTPIELVGSALLTPTASSRLQQALERFLRTEIAEGRVPGAALLPDDQPLDAARVADIIARVLNDQIRLPIARAYDELLRTPCLGQSLTGLNDLLIGRRQGYQLRVGDPLGDSSDKQFADTVSTAVGPFNDTSPVGQRFFPVRAGDLRVSQLRVIDAFGQSLQFTPPAPAAGSPGENFASLPPRVLQPSRLTFRFLSAANDSIEVNSHPESTPICGWILPDFVGENVLIYDSDGGMLGSILPDPDPDFPNKARWEPAPGGKGATVPSNFVDQHLRQAVEQVIARGAGYVTKFVQALDAALDHIHPETLVGHGALALLSGRALAVVRSVLFFELKGGPIENRLFSQPLGGALGGGPGPNPNPGPGPRPSGSVFPFTRFFLRLGDHSQIGDGLAGSWLLGLGGLFANPPFICTAHSDSPGVPSDPGIVLHDNFASVLALPLLGDSFTVTMLVDPHGSVHAITGVVPAKELTIPRDQFVTALHNIEVTFRAGPILTPLAAVNLPLSLEPGYDWSWIQREHIGWSEVSTQGLIEKPRVLEAFPIVGQDLWDRLVANRWLKLLDPFQAGIVPKQLRLVTTPPDPVLVSMGADLDAFLSKFQIGSADTTAIFTAQGIRDGWLMLAGSVDFTPPPSN